LDEHNSLLNLQIGIFLNYISDVTEELSHELANNFFIRIKNPKFAP